MKRSYVIVDPAGMFWTGVPNQWAEDLSDAARWQTLRAVSAVLDLMAPKMNRRMHIQAWRPTRSGGGT